MFEFPPKFLTLVNRRGFGVVNYVTNSPETLSVFPTVNMYFHCVPLRLRRHIVSDYEDTSSPSPNSEGTRCTLNWKRPVIVEKYRHRHPFTDKKHFPRSDKNFLSRNKIVYDRKRTWLTLSRIFLRTRWV